MLAEPAPAEAPCPEGPPPGTRCLRGTDSAGAHYLIAMPQQWNRVLVVHAHGGPPLGTPKVERADEDIKRWSITVRAGYAYAASVFRQGGVAVRSAAEDTERVRRIFVEHVARPRRTILHGQSWGAGVAAKAAEMYADSLAGASPYDGVLLTSGVIAGGSKAYDFRLDLRAVYQYLCGNHPKPDEAQYPLWLGLPKDAKLTRAELAARVDECLGVRRKPQERTAEQQHRLDTITKVIRIPAASVPAHLAWGTWHFQDIAGRSNGRSVFGNADVKYTGSPDDAALNAGVARYRPDPEALAAFAADSDPNGRIPVPVLTVHGIGDPTAFVEMESAFRETMEKAGSAARLVQTFTDHAAHSYLSDPTYPTAFDALLKWIDTGDRPTPAGISESCKAFEAGFGAGCRFLPDYRPARLEARVPPR
ncbi:MAG: hypothetical protein AB7G13_27825 [Lautropia sp.]